MLASSRWRSRPLSPGSRTSRTRQLGASGRLFSRNSCGVLNAAALRPTVPRSLVRASRIDGSSSTMYTITSSPLMADPSTLAERTERLLRDGRSACPQAPSMGPDDRSADRQPHAQSVRLRRVQGLEELIDLHLLEPHPCVLHGDQHTGVGAAI